MRLSDVRWKMEDIEELAQKLYVSYRESIVRDKCWEPIPDWRKVGHNTKIYWRDVAAAAYEHIQNKGN